MDLNVRDRLWLNARNRCVIPSTVGAGGGSIAWLSPEGTLKVGIEAAVSMGWERWLGDDGLFVLETNTQPGMTPLSLVPEQARYAGLDYGELCELVVAAALRDHAPKPGTGDG